MKRATLTLSMILAAHCANAVPVVDGILDAEYGAAVAVQGVQTGFGDNLSELNAAYATVSGGTLYLMVTGNLESNFNKLNIFIDSVAGGQNTIDGAMNPTNDGWAAKHNGMTFDAGFAPDFLFTARNGNFGGDRFDLDYAQIGGGAGDFDSFGDIFGGTLEGAATTGVGTLGFDFGVAFDNSNVAGVTGGTGTADEAAALAVMTGLELAVPLAALGNADPADIFISIMVNGSNHDFLSNQFLGSLLAPQGNLGGDGLGNFTGDLSGIDLNNFDGDQFFGLRIATSEPGVLLLLGVGLVGLATIRRRTT